MASRKRSKKIEFFVTEEEKNLILERARHFGFADLSSYLRKSAIDVTVININTDGLKSLARQVSLIGSNINQIVRDYNTSGTISDADIYMMLQYQKYLVELINRHFDNVSVIKGFSKVEE
jgi:hypothetical protein